MIFIKKENKIRVSETLKITCLVLSVLKGTELACITSISFKNWVKCFVPKPPCLCVWQFEAGGKLAKLSSPVFTVFTQS